MKLDSAIDLYLSDQRAYGRINSPRTEVSYRSRLQIRRLRDLGFYPDDIAECFGVKKSAVCSIGLRKSWRHVPEASA